MTDEAPTALRRATNWHKSSYSNQNGCVEVGSVQGWIGVRDSKAGDAGPVLGVAAQQWTAFLSQVTRGDLDLYTSATSTPRTCGTTSESLVDSARHCHPTS